ncbi:MAG: hypothetical protein DHS20C06_10340 [Hyphobacterium sp.]|nr:MAG: hypothetical protein DHS20C06_10340 [Hyphobacterium sp.]
MGDRNRYDIEHSIHWHSAGRLIVCVSGQVRERSFKTQGEFNAGDFWIRPKFMPHDGSLKFGGSYRSISISGDALKKFVECHGWGTRRGRLPADSLSHFLGKTYAGDSILREIPTTPIEPLQPATGLEAIAAEVLTSTEERLEQIAEHNGLSPWSFSRNFSKFYGMPPVKYRILSKLHHAMELLCHSSDKIAAIATEAGFYDQSHLHREMKKYFGVKPRDFASLALG